MQSGFSNAADKIPYSQLKAGESIFLGYPGSDFDKRVLLLTHINHQDGSATTFQINGKEILRLHALAKFHLGIDIDPAYDLPIHYGGPDNINTISVITNNEWQPLGGCSYRAGDYRVHTNHAALIALANGDGPRHAWLLVGSNQFSVAGMSDAIRYDRLGVLAATPVLVYSSAAPDILWDQAMDIHTGGRPLSFAVPPDIAQPHLPCDDASFLPPAMFLN